MKCRRREIGLGLFTSLFVGCGILPARPPEGVRHFVLATIPCSKQELEIPAISRVSIEASSSLQTSEIMYQKNRLERGHYQYAAWIEPVPDRLRTIIEDALSCQDIFVPQRSGRILRINIRDFFHDAIQEPGTAVVKIDVSVLDGPGGSVVAMTQLHAQKAVGEYSSVGAVTALDQATQQIVLELVEWLRTVQ